MKFNDAFDIVFDEMNKIELESNNAQFAVNPQTAKILALMWNIIVASKKELDDFAYIDKMNNIISIPIEGKESKKNKKTAILEETGAVVDEPKKKQKPKSATK